MEVKNELNDRRGHFYIDEGGKQIAGMYYLMAGPAKMVINHTEVDEAYSGKGLGKQLVEATVLYARQHQLKIMPLCSFAKKIFDRTPEFSDVLF